MATTLHVHEMCVYVGRLTCVCGCVCVQGLSPELVARLCDFTFAVTGLSILHCEDLPHTDLHTAATNILTQLAHVQVADADKCLIYLNPTHWEWTEQLSVCVARTELPCGVGVYMRCALNDEMLGELTGHARARTHTHTQMRMSHACRDTQTHTHMP